MGDFLLIHRRTARHLGGPFPIWRTCLRQIAFVSEQQREAAREAMIEGDELLGGADGLAFLVEVLCGLHSPVLGETEVFGQFRRFLAAEDGARAFSGRSDLVSFMVQVVKEVRIRHVTALGSNSYGSLLRKRLKGIESVSLCGTGQLAAELLPWISDVRRVQIFSRDGASATRLIEQNPDRDIKISAYDEPVRGRALIVAAPLSDEQISEMAMTAEGRVAVFDLRGDKNDLGRYLPDAVTLRDFFGALDEQKIKQRDRMGEIKAEIRRRAEEFLLRAAGGTG